MPDGSSGPRSAGDHGEDWAPLARRRICGVFGDALRFVGDRLARRGRVRWAQKLRAAAATLMLRGVIGVLAPARGAPLVAAAAQPDPVLSGSWLRLADSCKIAGERDAEAEALLFSLALGPDLPQAAGARHRLSVLLFESGRMAEARPHLEAVAAHNASDAEIWRRLAQCRRETGDASGEIDAWLRASKLRPDDIGILRQLAACSAAAGDQDTEVRTLRRMLERGCDVAQSHGRLAVLLYESGRLDEARVHLKAIVSADRSDAESWRRLALCRRAIGDVDGAIVAWLEADALAPNRLDVVENLAQSLVQRSRHAEAIPRLKVIAALHPGEAGPLRQLAASGAACADVEAQLHAWRSLLDLGTDDLQAHRSLAALLFGEGRRTEAQPHLEAVVAANPTDGDAWGKLAACRHDAGDREGEAAAWTGMLAVEPHNFGALLRLAKLRYHDRRLAEAISLTRAALDVDPNRVSTWIMLGRWLEEADARDEAMAAYRSAIDLGPPTGEAHSCLVQCLLQAGRVAEVPRILLDSWDRYAQTADTQRVCEALERLGAVDDALGVYEAISAKDPSAAFAWAGRGQIASRLHRRRLAASFFAQALKSAYHPKLLAQWLDSLLDARSFATLDNECERLIAKDPANPIPHTALVRSMIRQGRLRTALKRARAAAKATGEERFGPYIEWLSAVDQSENVFSLTQSVRTDARQETIFQLGEQYQAAGQPLKAAEAYRSLNGELSGALTFKAIGKPTSFGPDFLLIGPAASGAAWLMTALNAVDGVWILREDAPYFAERLRFSPRPYARRFAAAADKQAKQAPHATARLGEFAPSYFTMPDEAIALAAALYPRARIICVARSPVERAWAHIAWAGLACRTDAFSPKPGDPPPGWLADILDAGRYTFHLKRWAKWFAPEQIEIVAHDDLAATPDESLSRVLARIGADRAAAPLDPPATADPPMPPGMRAYLERACRDEVFDAGALQRMIASPHDDRRQAMQRAVATEKLD